VCEWCEEEFGPAQCPYCGRIVCLDIPPGYGDDNARHPYRTRYGDTYCEVCGPDFDDWIDQEQALAGPEPGEGGE
jgi:hypothetical protein